MSEETNKTMTFGDLKAELEKLSPEQLAMIATWAGDDRGGTVLRVDVLAEEHVQGDYGEGEAIPASEWNLDEHGEVVRRWPAGTTMLVVD